MSMGSKKRAYEDDLMTTNRKLNVLLAWGIPVSLVILKILGVVRFDRLMLRSG